MRSCSRIQWIRWKGQSPGTRPSCIYRVYLFGLLQVPERNVSIKRIGCIHGQGVAHAHKTPCPMVSLQTPQHAQPLITPFLDHYRSLRDPVTTDSEFSFLFVPQAINQMASSWACSCLRRILYWMVISSDKDEALKARQLCPVMGGSLPKKTA